MDSRNENESRPGKLSSCLSTTSSVVKSLVLPAATAASGYLSWMGIQVARNLDASQPASAMLKDALKGQFSLAASTVDAFNSGYSLYEFFETLISTGALRHLSAGQQVLVGTLVALGGAGAGYSMVYFGVEQNTLAAALSAAGGVFFFNAAKDATIGFNNNYKAQNSAVLDEETGLLGGRQGPAPR